jgi:hypothetical protein
MIEIARRIFRTAGRRIRTAHVRRAISDGVWRSHSPQAEGEKLVTAEPVLESNVTDMTDAPKKASAANSARGVRRDAARSEKISAEGMKICGSVADELQANQGDDRLRRGPRRFFCFSRRHLRL